MPKRSLAATIKELTCLIADPAWLFNDKLPGKTRGASRQYQCMTLDAIAAMNPLPPSVSPNSVLFLWRVAAMQEEALRVLRAWGYSLKSEIVWNKTTKGRAATKTKPAELPKPHFGMGRYVRHAHGVCLIGVRGRAPVAVRNERSSFWSPVREHSRKPEEFYEKVERLYPHAVKFELFARTPRHGYIQWWLESNKFEAVA